ncbi:receptor-like protein 12 [Phalaenopsis equestris]|uniref:receptor-like protein 12 n=1 Tax=Phalaenopsis equestris TaxID=78828 RepID=UPI0009E2C77E|nr:receptor-like protein 12 [Phalaenopsis equestris]
MATSLRLCGRGESAQIIVLGTIVEKVAQTTSNDETDCANASGTSILGKKDVHFAARTYTDLGQPLLPSSTVHLCRLLANQTSTPSSVWSDFIPSALPSFSCYHFWRSLFLELFSVVNCKALEQCLQKESSALLQLKRGFISGELDTWEPGTDCCFWVGVTCDESRRVTGLDLSDRSINGTIDPILFNLTSLETLNLSNNEFYNGSIPDSGWERLANLSSLDISWSELIGKVPAGISRLTKLTSLDLSYNEDLSFTANPTFLQNMSNLRELFLDNVNLSAYGVEWCGALINSTPELEALSMQGCSLFGYCPNKIFLLRNLKYLQISYNQILSGSLPDFPENSNLEKLNLFATNFSGNLPDTIGNLKFLTLLDLGECQFSGRIPPSMGNLSKQLKWLSLSNNYFSGPVLFLLPLSAEPSHNGLSSPDTHICLNGKLCHLEYLDLSHNNFSGPIPATVFTLPTLRFLHLQRNQFSGQLAEFTCASSMLTYVDLSNNKLQGQIPLSFFMISGLYHLDFSSNNFSGVVGSEFIKDLNDLTFLSLSNNKLTEIPPFIKYQHKNISLYLSDNRLTGEIPTFICNWTGLESLDLSNNELNGSIPPCLLESSGLKILTYLDYANNNLTGEIPIFICNLTNLQTLDLSNNKLNGYIPPCLLERSSLEIIMHLDLSKNQLAGEITTSFCNLTNLIVLDLSDNKLTGSIPSCLFEEGCGLRILNLRGNQLHGAIPHGVNQNCMLQIINLRDNQLEGLLPRLLSNCRSLELLDLGNNKLKVVFPYWLGNISTLRILILRSNKFHGLVGLLDGSQKTNYTFSTLNVLDISSNNFSGNLCAKCFNDFKSMMINTTDVIQSSALTSFYDYYSLVVLTIMEKGQLLKIQNFWRIIKSIDISNNYFEGEIPISIGQLASLQVLNLSQNHMTGTIPPQLGNLLQLESLDLSMNSLSGKIPTELVSLHFLSVLNLSYNKLVGEIPPGGQFSTFPDTSFEGNKGLCWHPCNTSVPTVNNKVPSTPSIDDTTSENKSYKIVLGLLFGVGLGGSMAAVLVVDVMCCDRSRLRRSIRPTHG